MRLHLKPIDSQDGFVSIVVTMVLMVVLSLIILGFAQIARREDRQALDRQLSTQAFYSAQSGINDAIKSYNSGQTTSKTTCALDPLRSPNGAVLDATSGTAYTCLLIGSSLPTLHYDKVTESSTIVPINSALISVLHISWQYADTSVTPTFSSQFTAGPSGTPLFPTQANFVGNTGVLEISLTPLDQLNRPSLIANTFTAYLYPENTGPGVNNVFDVGLNGNTPSKQGPVLSGGCNTGNITGSIYSCNVMLSDLLHNTLSGYILRIKSLYSDSTVNICGSTNSGSPATCDSLFTGAQLQIDATGKAKDILRRIQVRYPLRGTSGTMPEFAIESADSICKTLQVTPTSAEDDPNCPTLPIAGE